MFDAGGVVVLILLLLEGKAKYALYVNVNVR